MLILTRKLGESITIGDDIKVAVLGIHGRQVRLGIEAPPSVVVHREEIYVKIQEENRKASQSVKRDLVSIVRLIRGKIKGEGQQTTKPPKIDYTDKGNKRRKGPRRSRPGGNQ